MTPDSKALFLIAGDEARQPVFIVDLNGSPVREVLDSIPSTTFSYHLTAGNWFFHTKSVSSGRDL